VSATSAGVQRRGRLSVDADDVVMAGLVVAGVAHLAAVPDHLGWWPVAGVFFAVLGLLQLGLAVHVAVRPLGQRVMFAVLLGTAGVIVVYVLSRTIGLPGTPPVPAHGDRWVPGRSILPGGSKIIGPLDVVTLAAELATGAALFVRLHPPVRSRAANVLMVAGVAMWAGALTGLL
jgi:hypothetical protein